MDMNLNDMMKSPDMVEKIQKLADEKGISFDKAKEMMMQKHESM